MSRVFHELNCAPVFYTGLDLRCFRFEEIFDTFGAKLFMEMISIGPKISKISQQILKIPFDPSSLFW
jgi:hypothetical protein